MILNLLIGIAACIGHACIWVFVVNRAYARAINYRILRRLRMIPESLILLFPFALLIRLVVCDAVFFAGAPLAELTPVSRAMLLIPLPAFLIWLPIVIRWHLVLKPEFRTCDTAERFDFVQAATDEGQVEAIRGRGAGMFGLWPWNEIFQLEVNQKTIQLRSNSRRKLPRPLRFVHLSDLHFVGCPGPEFYRQVVRRAVELNPDAFLFTGDLIDEPELLGVACETLAQLSAHAPAYFILGNHDWRYDFSGIREKLVAAGWVDVGSRSIVERIEGVRVGFSGTELPWLGQQPASPGDCDVSILLSHSPDQIRFAIDSGYDVMVAGHTHGGQVVLPVAGPVFSPSRYGTRFASGIFHRGGMTLHVSRGVGAKDPLRWNCLPELTLLRVCENASTAAD